MERKLFETEMRLRAAQQVIHELQTVIHVLTAADEDASIGWEYQGQPRYITKKEEPVK
jgi:hypothetical protein